MFEEFSLEIFTAIGIPTIGALVFVVRHFWIKDKMFVLMKHRLEYLEEENQKGKDTHIEIFKRLNNIDKHIANIEGKIDILIKKEKLI